ncbi:hypothetical protein [Parafrankia sp. FMc2]|uniref:hypothetical protein n=1 Tax=Parafrankia sp. FMc2 TaxID=3233196 RepID=UPI0034D6B085
MSRRWYRVFVSGVPVHTEQPPPSGGDGKNVRDLLDLDDDALRRHAATHEAGHVVVAHHRGLPVEEVAVDVSITDGNGLPLVGVCRYGPFDVPWQDFGATCAAGGRAANRWLRQEGLATPGRLWANELSTGNDQVTLAQACADLPAPVVLTYGQPGVAGGYEWADLGDAAEAELDRDWPAVHRVADALYREGRLTGSDIDDLI